MKRVFVCIVAALILMVNLTISVNANSTAFDLNYFIQQYKELLVERSPEEAIAAKARADALGASEIELNLAEKYYNAYLADVYDGDEIPVMSTRSVQLNTTFVNRFGALQDLARTYVNSLETDGSYDFEVDDEYNGMKDVWYCFYFLRYLAVDSNGERRYMNDLWNYGGSGLWGTYFRLCID